MASKETGLFIRRLFAFECDLYKVSFHLWDNVGPNWRREFELFLEEERSSWHPVFNGRPVKPSYAAVVRSSAAKPPLSGANAIPLGNGPARISAFQRIAPPRKSVFERLEPAPYGVAPPRPSSGHSDTVAPPWLQLALDALLLAITGVIVVGQSNAVHASPRGMSPPRVLSWPLKLDK